VDNRPPRRHRHAFRSQLAKVARFIKIEAEQDTGNLWWRIEELRVLQ